MRENRYGLRYRWPFRGSSQAETIPLAIFDDVFPYAISGFRLVEYRYLLRSVANSRAYSTLATLKYLGVSDLRDSILDNWDLQYPEISDRLTIIRRPNDLPDVACLYTMFLNNALSMLRTAERRHILFSFTLYPGGGLKQGNRAIDDKLRRIAASPSFFKVIVTQPAVLSYLRRQQIFEPQKIEYVFGGVLGQDLNPISSASTVGDHAALRLGFVANRYHPQGLDKGFDIFVGAAISLIDMEVPVECHFVGPWTSQDIEQRRLQEKSIFHGLTHNDDLRDLLAGIEVCVFPTRSEMLGEGSFDGFPVGSAVEAGIAGCAVLTSNPLQQETPLEEGSDYLEITADVNNVRDRILELHNDRTRLNKLRRRAQEKFAQVYSNERQLEPRLRVIREMIRAASSKLP